MLGKFYIITLNTGAKNPPNAKIENVLGAYDWLRFSRDAYYVYAHGITPEKLYNQLKPVLETDEDLIMVAETIVESRRGWVSQLAVEWFTRPRI